MPYVPFSIADFILYFTVLNHNCEYNISEYWEPF